MSVTIKNYLKQTIDEETRRKLFYNMSATMKYIHSYDYYISNFNPAEIEIKNIETLSPIQYNYISKMEEENEKLIQQNIEMLALMQVGIYTNTLEYLKASNIVYIKEHFQEFEQFLPEVDVPYLRGVIQRNSPVYYCDFVKEKNKREITKLEEATGVSSNNTKGIGIQKVKATEVGTALADKETEKLYSNLDDKQAAFTNFLILPIAMILLGGIISVIIAIFN